MPPGEVTLCRNSASSSVLSKAILAAPKAVCNVSKRAVSRGSPRCSPALCKASMTRKKYAGPLPDSAVTASIKPSSLTQRVIPTARRMDSARFFCSLLTALLANKAVAPLRTKAGVLGMVRTMAMSSPIHERRSLSRIPAAMEITSGWLPCITDANSRTTDLAIWGLIARITT